MTANARPTCYGDISPDSLRLVAEFLDCKDLGCFARADVRTWQSVMPLVRKRPRELAMKWTCLDDRSVVKKNKNRGKIRTILLDYDYPNNCFLGVFLFSGGDSGKSELWVFRSKPEEKGKKRGKIPSVELLGFAEFLPMENRLQQHRLVIECAAWLHAGKLHVICQNGYDYRVCMMFELDVVRYGGAVPFDNPRSPKVCKILVPDMRDGSLSTGACVRDGRLMFFTGSRTYLVDTTVDPPAVKSFDAGYCGRVGGSSAISVRRGVATIAYACSYTLMYDASTMRFLGRAEGSVAEAVSRTSLKISDGETLRSTIFQLVSETGDSVEYRPEAFHLRNYEEGGPSPKKTIACVLWNDRMVFLGTKGDRVHVVDSETKELMRTLPGSKKPGARGGVSAMRFVDGCLCVAYGSGMISKWSTNFWSRAPGGRSSETENEDPKEKDDKKKNGKRKKWGEKEFPLLPPIKKIRLPRDDPPERRAAADTP